MAGDSPVLWGHAAVVSGRARDGVPGPGRSGRLDTGGDEGALDVGDQRTVVVDQAVQGAAEQRNVVLEKCERKKVKRHCWKKKESKEGEARTGARNG